MATGQVGHHIDRRALGQARAVPGRSDLARELVAHHARIFEVRVLALEDVQVGAAHAHAPDAQDDLALLGLGPCTLGQAECPGSIADDGAHGLPR